MVNNLQCRIPEELKMELGILAMQLHVRPKSIVTEALEHYLPIKRRELGRKANGKKA